MRSSRRAWIIAAVLLFVGWRCYAYYRTWVVVNRSPFETQKPEVPVEPKRYAAPIPDPDSDIIIVETGSETGLVRYSAEKGFWGAEEGVISRSAFRPVLVKGVVVASSLGTNPHLISFDVTAQRPWPATEVIPLDRRISRTRKSCKPSGIAHHKPYSCLGECVT